MSLVMMTMMMMSEDRGKASKTIATFILLLHTEGRMTVGSLGSGQQSTFYLKDERTSLLMNLNVMNCWKKFVIRIRSR